MGMEFMAVMGHAHVPCFLPCHVWSSSSEVNGIHARARVPTLKKLVAPLRHVILHGRRRGEGQDGAGKSVRERGFDAARSGNPAVASDLLLEYLQQQEACRDWAALNCLGAMSAQLGRFEDAVESFQQSLAASVREAELPSVQDARANTFFNLGNAFTALSRHSEALAAFEQCTLLRPTDTEAVTNMGNALIFLNNHSAALKMYQRAVDLDGSSAIALLNCGNALCDAGRTNEGPFTVSSRSAA
jgi:tetratricopeptide (TPR) repeat protein